MRNLWKLERGKVKRVPLTVKGEKDYGDDKCGAFLATGLRKEELRIIVASDGGWDHVSVSLANRMPAWSEMEAVKRVFFEDNETAMQLHVPPSDHINCHPYTLHLWRPHDVEIPRPPASMV